MYPHTLSVPTKVTSGSVAPIKGHVCWGHAERTASHRARNMLGLSLAYVFRSSVTCFLPLHHLVCSGCHMQSYLSGLHSMLLPWPPVPTLHPGRNPVPPKGHTLSLLIVTGPVSCKLAEWSLFLASLQVLLKRLLFYETLTNLEGVGVRNVFLLLCFHRLVFPALPGSVDLDLCVVIYALGISLRTLTSWMAGTSASPLLAQLGTKRWWWRHSLTSGEGTLFRGWALLNATPRMFWPLNSVLFC